MTSGKRRFVKCRMMRECNILY